MCDETNWDRAIEVYRRVQIDREQAEIQKRGPGQIIVLSENEPPWRGYESLIIGLVIGGIIGLIVALVGIYTI
jgi:hypothetical protein